MKKDVCPAFFIAIYAKIDENERRFSVQLTEEITNCSVLTVK